MTGRFILFDTVDPPVYHLPMIDVLRNFFDINDALVFFVYGQVFFILGLAIALQSRRHSRLELARTLRWLSAFGIVHGFHEWGLFFIPIQSTYADVRLLSTLQSIQVLLLGLSFTFLFQFGAELLRDRWPWLIVAPGLVALGWVLWVIVGGVASGRSLGEWQQLSSIWARYLIGFPGALLAAFGLRYQADRQIKPLNLTHIYRTLRVAGLALAVYAFLAGLVVPAGEFFPASWLNDSLPVRYSGVPVPVFRSMAGLVMAVAIIRALEVFDVEVDQLIEQMETDQTIVAERERIGRELHDGAIQQAYTAGLIIESAQRKAGADSQIGLRLERAMAALNQSIDSLRAYMNELRPGPTAMSLAEGLRQQATDPRFTSLMDVDLKLDISQELALNPLQTAHVLAIAAEALSNAARHAHAHHVLLQAIHENGRFTLNIEDDGRGFGQDAGSDGYGLRNMRDRARLLGGDLTISSEPGGGTRVSLTVPG